MAVDKVPPPDFMGTTGQVHDEYTIRKPSSDMPSKPLEEAIAASMLRAARRKFDARPWLDEDSDDTDSDGPIDTEVDETDVTDDVRSMSSRLNSRSRSRSVTRTDRTGSESAGESAVEGMRSGNSSNDDADTGLQPMDDGYLVTMLAADDDRSYDILQPKVRSTLAKLDRALQILHGGWESIVNDQSESEDSATSGSSRLSRMPAREGSQPAVKKKRGRPRKDAPPSGSRGSETPSGVDQNDGKKKSKRGRPKKDHGRLEGETDMEYAVRMARLHKKRIPTFTNAQPGGVGSGKESSRESTPDKTLVAKRIKDVEPTPEPQEAKKSGKEWWRKRARLRDWKSVLNAAAMSGFPRGAIDAAARRCATLFHESAEFHFVSPVGQDPGDGIWPRTYVPGMPLPPLLDLNDYDDDDEAERKMPSKEVADAASDVGEAPSRGRSRSGSRRSRSRSASAAGMHLCHFRDCPRAVAAEGFSRRQNLFRHLRLVHGIQGDAPPTTTKTTVAVETEVDSEDEILDGVHRDGFLKPIRIRPGWRSRDASAEPRKRRRTRKDATDETDGDRMSSS